MNVEPNFIRPHVGTKIVAAVLSVMISLGLFSTIVALFQHDGAPLEQIVIAERVCAQHRFVSEREACMRMYLAASHLRNVANR